jgi:hypothetical protein
MTEVLGPVIVRGDGRQVVVIEERRCGGHAGEAALGRRAEGLEIGIRRGGSFPHEQAIEQPGLGQIRLLAGKGAGDAALRNPKRAALASQIGLAVTGWGRPCTTPRCDRRPWRRRVQRSAGRGGVGPARKK